MCKPASSILLSSRAVVLAACLLGASAASAAPPPVFDARVINTNANPVPVIVITPPPPPVVPTVQCKIELGLGSSSTPFASGGSRTNSMSCPAGVTAIDLERVIHDANGGTLPSVNVAHYTLLFSLGPQHVTTGTVIALATQSAPDVRLPTAVRVSANDQTGQNWFHFGKACSSGIAGINVGCGGIVYLIGKPVN